MSRLTLAVVGEEFLICPDLAIGVFDFMDDLVKRGYLVESFHFFREAGRELLAYLDERIEQTDCLLIGVETFEGGVENFLEPLTQGLDSVSDRHGAVHYDASPGEGGWFGERTRSTFLFPSGHCLSLLGGIPGRAPFLRSVPRTQIGQSGPAESCLHVMGCSLESVRERVKGTQGLQPLSLAFLPEGGGVAIVPRHRSQEERARCLSSLRALFPGECLPSGCGSLAQTVIWEARKSGLSLAAAESCTGGLIGAELTGISGASSVFLGSAVCYANGAKQGLLGVSVKVLETRGAVSEECALAMARGGRRLYGADLCVSVTGIAGPNGGSSTKPVGTVWFGLASPHRVFARKCFFQNRDREGIRRSTVLVALEMLWKAIRQQGEDSSEA